MSRAGEMKRQQREAMTDQELQESFEWWAKSRSIEAGTGYEHADWVPVALLRECYQAAYRAGREDQREADARVCESLLSRPRMKQQLAASVCLDCAAAIREAKP